LRHTESNTILCIRQSLHILPSRYRDAQLPSASPRCSPRPLPSSDACIHASVCSRPASSLHAMSRLQRCADAFAIAPHAVQDRSLGPDACIHASHSRLPLAGYVRVTRNTRRPSKRRRPVASSQRAFGRLISGGNQASSTLGHARMVLIESARRFAVRPITNVPGRVIQQLRLLRSPSLLSRLPLTRRLAIRG
jgi:hypothetical protein